MAPPARGGGKASGRAALKEVRDRLARGWPAGLTVLSGEDRYHLDTAQREILERLAPKDSTEYALTVISDDEAEVGRVVGAAQSRSMFSSRRVVLVGDGTALKGDPEDLTAYASDPPESSFLIVRAVKLDRKRKLHQALATAGTFLEFQPGSGSEQAREAIEMAAERGLLLDEPTASFLVDVCMSDLHRVATELEKIRCYVGDGGKARVEVATIRELAAGSGLLSGWEIADAVLKRSTRDAIAAVRDLLATGEEPIRLVGGLAWRARSMLQAKAMLEAGVQSREVIAAARAWAYGDAFLAGLKRYTLQELLAFPKHLLTADLALKGGTTLPAIVVLESLVSSLTLPARKVEAS